jgi:DNA-binding response OmpR family regulator/HPt (histidine-containing phosphotransfer) domain-containing protein
MKILLVEDDEIFGSSLVETLASVSYTVEWVADGQTGWDYAQATNYDLIILDWDLPNLDGKALCQRLRQARYAGAILLLTSKGDERFKVAGLDAGADDYVVKSCSPGELVARLRALLRRPRELMDTVLVWGTLHLDLNTCQVTVGDQALSLSPKEYGLLELFLRNPQRVFSSAVLLERLWTFEETPGEDTVRTHIKRLRRKLKKAGTTGVIENIYGMGYRLAAPPTEGSDTLDAPSGGKEPPAPEEPPPAEAPPAMVPRDRSSPFGGTMAAAEVSSLEGNQTEVADPAVPLAAMARAATMATLGKYQSVLEARIAHLEAAAIALQTQPSLSEDLRQSAQHEAHKLAGSLGMFGLTAESDQCKGLEADLAEGLVDPQPVLTVVQQVRQGLQTLVALAPAVASADEPDSVAATGGAGPAQVTSPASWPAPPPALEPEPYGEALLVVTARVELAQQLQALAPPTLAIAIAPTWSQAEKILAAHPRPVLVDLPPAFDQLEALAAYAQTCGAVPLWLLPQGVDALPLRRTLAPYGHCTFLAKDLSPEQLVAQVFSQLVPLPPQRPHILAVDDDPLVLAQLTQQLTDAGMVVTTLDDPLQFWTFLAHNRPDLVILDIEMPHLEGVELCQMVRRDRQWAQLPILFLTSREGPSTRQRVYAAGADDYIPKPWNPDYLTTRIRNRVQRQQTAYTAHWGALTLGTLAPPQALNTFQRDLSLAQRHRQPYCLALLRLQQATVAETPPSWAQGVVQGLQGKLRREDLLLQVDTHTLLLGLYGLPAQQADQRLDSLTAELTELSASANEVNMKILTGYAIAPDEGTTLPLLWALANQKLHNAIA